MGLLDGKVAVITGAGRGIGRTEALLLASEGASVVVNDVGAAVSGESSEERPAEEVVNEIKAAGGTAIANFDDITSWDGGQRLIQQATEELGGLDILVNNAGILRDRMSFNMDEKDWDAVINVHLKGHFVPSRFAGAYWRAKAKETGEPVNAAIINTSSEAGLFGNAGQLNYGAAKAGIAAMTIILARELERFGVRPNAIAPRARTRMTELRMGTAGAAPGDSGFDTWAREWQATLFDHGWIVPGYPPELGGRNATPVQTLIFQEELCARGLPRSLHFPGWAIVAPSLLEFGTDEQKALAPAALRGDMVWCIGMSEPDAGSDLASLTTRAVLDGDRFLVTGQKVWTSYAMDAQKCFCYVRTNPDVPKHKGITVLIIDMDTPGIDIRPLRQITGSTHFAEVFFDEVPVPRENVIGAVDDGWRVTMGSLAHERGGLWLQTVAGVDHVLTDLKALAKRTGADGNQAVRRRLADAHAQVSGLKALGYKGFSSFAQGSSAPEHSYLKMATSELQKSLFELGMELEGPAGIVIDKGHHQAAGRWAFSFFTSFAGTIAGGTAEIQRNIIAERVLGLPRGK